MALDFPANPLDGQLYPEPAQPGVQQYVYNADKGTWLTVFPGVSRVTAVAPLFTSGSRNEPVINIRPATETESGYMTPEDKQKLDEIDPLMEGTVKKVTAGVGLGAPNAGESITIEGTLNLLPPTPGSIGGVKEGVGVTVLSDGSLSLKPPSSLSIGGVKAGAGVSITADGTISVSAGGTFINLDDISRAFNGIATNFQMTVSGVPFAPTSQNALLIFVGGVIQQPNFAFTTSSSNLTFTAPPPAGASFYGISLT
jgi:hypothetical protein